MAAIIGTAALPSLPPLAPGQTSFQKALTKANSRLSAELSPIATGPLLVALGSPEIKQTLRACCGSWADRPATELLAALRDYVSSVEVVHNFDALPPKHASGGRPGRLGASGATCVDLKLAAAAPYLPNLWDVEFLNATSGICSNPSENNAERAIMGFRPFTSSKEIVDFGKNVSMPFPGRYAEAAERPVYTAMNLLREDAGSGNFGSVGMVLSRPRIDPMLLLSPQDTGSWECRCNSSAPPWMKQNFPVNCSAWSSTGMALGSAGHFDHTLLTSLSCWADSHQLEHLGHILSRAFATDGAEVNMTTDDQLQGYLEADVAGVVSFPEDVSMVIGSFRELFGTDAGTQLQHWCAEHAWPLVWALGPGVNDTSFHGLDRIVDVPTLETSARINRTADRATAAAFTRIWDEVRAAQGPPPGPGLDLWSQLAEAVGSSLILRALPGGTPCSGGTSCVGIDRHHDCACPRSVSV